MTEETQIVEVLDTGALEKLHGAEFESQVDIAKRYPRSITASHREAEALACLDEETAASCFYSLPRAGKRIEGPSIRLAEIVANSWGNLRCAARVVEVGREYVVAQGICFDMEKNVATTIEAKRRITNKRGERYNADMIGTTANAACSIALRNAIFRVVPFALVKPIYEKARAVSLGKDLTMAQRRERAFTFYREHGATEAQILAALERKGIEDITIDDLLHLRGMVTAIRDGELRIEDALRPPSEGPPVRPKVRESALVGIVAAEATDAKGTPLGKANDKMAEALSGLEANMTDVDPETGVVG